MSETDRTNKLILKNNQRATSHNSHVDIHRERKENVIFMLFRSKRIKSTYQHSSQLLDANLLDMFHLCTTTTRWRKTKTYNRTSHNSRV